MTNIPASEQVVAVEVRGSRTKVVLWGCVVLCFRFATSLGGRVSCS
jgi:hypothetical protein